MQSEPVQYCELCHNFVIVKPDGRGFPPDIAKRKLIKQCKSNGCRSKPRYRAGISLIPRMVDLSHDANDSSSTHPGIRTQIPDALPGTPG